MKILKKSNKNNKQIKMLKKSNKIKKQLKMP